MSAVWWFAIGAGAVVWLAGSVGLAVWIGRGIVLRDRQKPAEPQLLRNVGFGLFPLPGEKQRQETTRESLRRIDGDKQ